ncbi:hypothetical protein [Sphingomonas sp. BK235]|uniref:hypothetical protein n=1 Tax=Sphingomonas sp. BK235 TaxID=2512131 RepID=UPI001047B745|nr:hypothetical protein [Sphingomonas sp. BK235]TCP36723.1 hypothetical protein EV292_101219 [Sphingomonas sp. BK235]
MDAKILAAAVFVTCGLAITPARAADDDELRGLFACLPLTADAARLACLDRETRALQQRDVADRARPRGDAPRSRDTRAERAARSEEEAFRPVDDVLVEATLFAGRWLFATKANGVWQQATPVELGRSPRVGDRLRVRRGALGSYLANVGDGPAIRVRRLR